MASPDKQTAAWEEERKASEPVLQRIKQQVCREFFFFFVDMFAAIV